MVWSGLFMTMQERQQIQSTVAGVQQKFNLKYKQNIHQLRSLDIL